jgi:hypothetical protein
VSKARRRRRLLKTQRFSQRTNDLMLPSWDRRFFRVQVDGRRVIHTTSGRRWPHTRPIWLPGLGLQ